MDLEYFKYGIDFLERNFKKNSRLVRFDLKGIIFLRSLELIFRVGFLGIFRVDSEFLSDLYEKSEK